MAKPGIAMVSSCRSSSSSTSAFTSSPPSTPSATTRRGSTQCLCQAPQTPLLTPHLALLPLPIFSPRYYVEGVSSSIFLADFVGRMCTIHEKAKYAGWRGHLRFAPITNAPWPDASLLFGGWWPKRRGDFREGCRGKRRWKVQQDRGNRLTVCPFPLSDISFRCALLSISSLACLSSWNSVNRTSRHCNFRCSKLLMPILLFPPSRSHQERDPNVNMAARAATLPGVPFVPGTLSLLVLIQFACNHTCQMCAA